MKKFCFPFLFFALACNRPGNLSQTILRIKEGGQLVTAEYTLSKIIRTNDNQTWYKIGDRKIIMSCEARLKAGVDLQGITEKNVVRTDSSLTLYLPPAQIFSLSLPPEKIQTLYQEIDALRHPFSAAEREALVAQAEVQVRQLADSLGIVQTAQNNAAVYLQKIFQQAGFEEVNIVFQK